MEFPQQFRDWLSASAAQLVPGVQAFCFNLHHPAGISGVTFGVELIGARYYSRDDVDWPCHEVWEPSPRGLDIPDAFSGLEWEDCLERIEALVTDYLSDRSADWLRTGAAIAVGFVDGDLHVVWEKEE